ncbi:MAG TPA: carboxypeptidase-like regulatory domain-containing protein, partial [Vicinamibacterales bacterium]|nr:carboxypeptidase-like regulatory domain-containing protein [Vicinamibacterales bacterium]
MIDRHTLLPPGLPARLSARRGRAARAVLVWAAVGIASVSPAPGQTATATTGVLQGTVTDATGGVLPGVTLTLTDLATGTVRETVSTESGHYSFISVLPGRYRLTAALEGFQQAVVPEVVIEVNKTISVDLKLAVGQLTETVDVTAGLAPLLQRNDATIVN